MNYYPLKHGKESTIISDINPWPMMYNANEFEKHNGYVLAENVPMHIAHQLIEAYNEKHGPSQRHPLIVVYGEPASSRYPIVQASDLLDDPNDFSQDAAMKAMEKVNSMLEKDGLVVVFKKSPVRGHIGQELMKKAHVYFYIDNSAHSFTEGADVEYELIPPFAPLSPEMQMKDALDRGELPNSIISTELVDVEKVIKDLMALAKEINSDSVHPINIASQPAIQNAEAALGMLQAFKKQRKPSGDVGSRFDPDAIREFNKRGHIGPELQPTGESFKMPIKHGRLQKILTKEQREYLVTEISANLPFYKDVNVQFAEAIIFAVDEIDKLKNV